MATHKRYGVIIADPPWLYRDDKGGLSRLGGIPYPMLSVSDICNLSIPALCADNCILFLWGTWPQVPSAVQVMAYWGFEHVTGFPWVKLSQCGTPFYGIGHWVAGCSQYVLIGRRGWVSPPPPPHFLGLLGDLDGMPGMLISPTYGHSRKPDSIHQLAETLPGPYLELFARRTRPGWDVWGNEVESSMAMPPSSTEAQ